MQRYRIAGVTVDMDVKYDRLKRQAKPYEIKDNGKPAQMTLSLTEENYERARKKTRSLSDEDLEYLLFGFLFYDKLLDFDGIMFHASAVVTGGWCYLFSADSGVGKSTHTSHWLSLLGDNAYILNDDKPALRIIGGKVFAFGTPFSGKHDISENRMAPLGGICFLSRGSDNVIEKVSPVSALGQFLKQTDGVERASSVEKRLKFLDKLLVSVPVYKMSCINDISAASVSFNMMKRAVSVKLDDLLELIELKLSENGSVFFQTKGKSMAPMLVGGRDSVELQKVDSIKKNQVVLYKNNDGKYVLHRIKKIKGDYIITRGDGLPYYDEPVLKEKIIGTVTHFQRGSKMLSASSLSHRLYAAVYTSNFMWVLRKAKRKLFK